MRANKNIWGYLKRYTIVHVLVYLVVGLSFMTFCIFNNDFYIIVDTCMNNIIMLLFIVNSVQLLRSQDLNSI
jgi:hypothetical protein